MLSRNHSEESTTTDAELVRAARRGDKRAFVEIVARHQAMVCGIAYSILGDFAASEDAAQESFLTAWRKFHHLREPERLRSWLGQIARNAALGYLRRDKDSAPLQDAPDLADASPAPDEMAASAEEAALVNQSLAKLPETYRLPLILYYREGKSVRAVADALGISEDAVKQRLARGRDMLREQMSSLVESVLTRTNPTAVFTMAIAVAIGALAAPAAVASGVFAAAGSTLGSASTATATTPIITIMSTTKALLLTAALAAVASVPLGYHLHAQRRLAVKELPTPALEAAGTPTNAASLFENSALVAEWRELHARFGTNSAAMPLLYKAINELKDPFRKRAFRAALVSEWVQVDPAGGLSFLFGKGHGPGERKEFFQEWLAVNPGAALDGLMAAGPGWEKVAHDALGDIAKVLPSRLPDVVAQLPDPENFWDTKVRDAFTIMGGDNLEAARTAALALSGKNREQALQGVAGAWAKSDPQAAISWANSLPGGVDRAEMIRCALVGLAGVNPAAALDQVGLVPPGGKSGFFASTTGARVLQAAANTDFDGTVAWIASHPGVLGQEDLLGIAQAVTDRINADPAGFLNLHAADGSLAAILPAVGSALLNGATSQQGAVWDWLKTQPASDAVNSLRQQVLNAVAWQNPTQALQFVPDLPANAEGDSEIKTLANSLLNGGSMLYRFDSLYSQAPGRLQAPLLETAFNSLRADNLGDPQSWISRLSLLPDSARASGTESIARAWAQASPEQAITWLQSLPPDTTRSGAAAAIATAWAATDAPDATQWVSAMSPGPERDQSTRALAMAMSETNPQNAWNLAMSIGDPTQREDAATQVAKMIAGRDPATARQWIEAGPFAPDQKAQLEAALAAGATTAGN